MIQVLKLNALKFTRWWLPLAFVSLTGGLLVLLIFAALVYQIIYFNRVYPGVIAAGVEAGGLTQPELINAVAGRAPAYLNRPLTLQAYGQSWTFTGQELGMRVDAAATAAQTYAVGRQGNLLADMLTQLRLRGAARRIDPVIVYDTGPSNRILQNLAAQIYRPPQNAQLLIHPDARIETTPAQRGRQLHLDGSRPLLEQALLGNNPQPVVMAVTQEILPPIPDVEIGRKQAENLLQPHLFRFTGDDGVKEWQLEPSTMVNLLEIIEKVDAQGQTQVLVRPKLALFDPLIQQLIQVINREPVNARLRFNDESGQLEATQESREGRILDIEALRRQLLTLADQPTPVIELPVMVLAPVVSSKNLASLGITQLVSEATTYFKGSSAGRAHNIALAATKFDSAVIPPDGTFSFNQILGEVSADTGYDESFVILGDRTAMGVGGGICQVSTTAFRAALFGGFELVERWPHDYRVSWYETKSLPGLDATVYTPDVDFKFRNDSGHYLLIHTQTNLEDGTVTFRFYGTPTGRQIEITEPTLTNPVKHGPPLYENDPSLPKGITQQIDWAKDGVDVTITRTIILSDVIIHRDVIVSQYRPWRAIYKVGTAEKATNGRP